MIDSIAPHPAAIPVPSVRSRVGPGTWTLLLAGALLMRLFVAASAPLIEVDGAYWAGLARAMAHGDWGHGLSAAWPPLYPAATALAFRALTAFGAPDVPATLEWAARTVSVIAGTLVLLPLH